MWMYGHQQLNALQVKSESLSPKKLEGRPLYCRAGSSTLTLASTRDGPRTPDRFQANSGA